MVSTQDAEFDHRPPSFTNLEFQKRRTKTEPMLLNFYFMWEIYVSKVCTTDLLKFDFDDIADYIKQIIYIFLYNL